MNVARATEVSLKLQLVRDVIGPRRVLRLKGIDWFAWMTAGGASEVLLAAETGIAEVVITEGGAYVVTNDIEAQRLIDEQLPEGFEVRILPWAYPSQRQVVMRELAQGMPVLSDRPEEGERELPMPLLTAKMALTPPEIHRYQEVGLLAAQAMTETLKQARPDWTELQLSGAGAAALLTRGLAPALVMAAGERRLRLYRHPMPTSEPLGGCAMLVFCARGFGLYANLTRFVAFRPLAPEQELLHRQVREVEAHALEASRPGASLHEVYRELASAYAAAGYEQAIREHHQGGVTGYLSRELLASPEVPDRLAAGMAVAWNPSITGAKVEDTFLVTESGLLNLTLDPAWPTVPVAELERPLVLQR